MAPEPAAVRIGDFVFDRSTGEVSDASGSQRSRLAPQPAKLLELLIEKNGELATRDEIRARVWPETHVDFDQSLHFCVRQIRAAFGDSAAEPSYVETLPRRGYRLARPAVAVDAGSGRSTTTPPARSGRRLALYVAAVVAVLAVALLLLPRRSSVSPPAPRLAIMPFELATEGARGRTLARISEWLVAELPGGGIDVVGPRSTAPYSAFPFPDLDRMASELGVDHVLNARYLEDDGEVQLIVELIRMSDRAHPWVELYDDADDWRAIARDTRDGVISVLEPDSRDP